MGAMAVPIAPEKLDAWKAWTKELSGPRKAEFDASNARHQLTGHHAWLQANPASGFACSYTDPNLIERLVDWLGQLWPFMFLATGLCSSKEWLFLGLSMANWSIICFGALALALVPFLRRTLRKR